tara:strand:+ start:3149 stop:3640 length:492 start_codon:yes stop_codon:yes gene_type:complete
LKNENKRNFSERLGRIFDADPVGDIFGRPNISGVLPLDPDRQSSTMGQGPPTHGLFDDPDHFRLPDRFALYYLVMIFEEIVATFTDSDLIKLDGYDYCVIGYHEDSDRLVYSMQKIVDQIHRVHSIHEENFTRSDAFEFFSHNIQGASCGPKTPMIIYDMENW